LGLFLIINLSRSSLYVPGVCLGIDLIFFGCALFGIAGAFRKLEKTEEKSEKEIQKIRKAG